MQNILFDVDGVLIQGYHYKPEKRVCWDKNLKEDFGINPDEFAKGFIFGPFMNEVVIGKTNLLEALQEYLPSVGCNASPESFIDYWNEKDANVNPEVLTVVKKLQNMENIQLHVATNQSSNRADYLKNNLKFKDHFQNIFDSASIGYKKPDTAYFAEVHKRLGNPSTPPIFFDDTPEVVEAAKAFGWKAYTFDDIEDLYKDDTIKKLLEK